MICIITPEQTYILSILQKTKVMRKEQALRLLKKLDDRRHIPYVERCLGQLRYLRKIVWETEDIFTIPILHNEPIDSEMLAAIDIMIDLTDFKAQVLSAATLPYKLSFLTGREDSLKSFAVVIVHPGEEAKVMAFLQDANPESRTNIFLLADMAQKDAITTPSSHFIAICDGGKYRYFKGGD